MLKRKLLGSMRRSDAGEISVSTRTILIGGFALVTVLVGVWLNMATMNRAADVTSCVESASLTTVSNEVTGCDDTTHVDDHSFTDKEDYTERYPAPSSPVE